MNLTGKRKIEPPAQCQQSWPNAWIRAREVRSLGAKVDKRPHAHNAMRMETEEVVVLRVKLGRLDQVDGEVVAHVSPYLPAAHPLGASALALGCVAVVDDPGNQQE